MVSIYSHQSHESHPQAHKLSLKYMHSIEEMCCSIVRLPVFVVLVGLLVSGSGLVTPVVVLMIEGVVVVVVVVVVASGTGISVNQSKHLQSY